MLDDHQRDAVVARLERLAPVAALWLFGSVARGAARPDSDLDLAVLFGRPVEAVERLAAAVDLASVVGRPVDLIDLDQASPIVAVQALRDGHLLHEGDRARRLRFLTLLPSRYEDLRLSRRSAEAALLRRLRHG